MKTIIIKFLKWGIRLIDSFFELAGMPITGPDYPPPDEEDEIEERRRYL